MSKSIMTRRKFGAAAAAGLIGTAAQSSALSMASPLGMVATSNANGSEAAAVDENDVLLVGAFAFRESTGKLEAYGIDDHVPFLIVADGSGLGQSGAFTSVERDELKMLHPYFESPKSPSVFQAMCLKGWQVSVGESGRVDVDDKNKWWPSVSTVAKAVDGKEYEFDKGTLVARLADGTLSEGPATKARGRDVEWTFAHKDVGLVDGPRRLTDIAKFEHNDDVTVHLTKVGSPSLDVKPKKNTPAWIVNLPTSQGTATKGTCPVGEVLGNVLTHGDHYFMMLRAGNAKLLTVPQPMTVRLCVPVAESPIEIKCKNFVENRWIQVETRMAAPPDSEFCYQVFL